MSSKEEILLTPYLFNFPITVIDGCASNKRRIGLTHARVFSTNHKIVRFWVGVVKNFVTTGKRRGVNRKDSNLKIANQFNFKKRAINILLVAN